MPRKSKEKVEELENKKATSTKKSSVKATTNKTKTASTTKKVASKKSDTKVTKKPTKKNPTTKQTATKKSTTKTTKKAATAKKTKAKVTKKVASKTTKKVAKSKKPVTVEYYDLPQKYNKTVIKLLAQTPKTLFVYWEISDDDMEKFKEQYGENFFETTKPVLIVHNDTLNYSFEVDINDFANSWYIHVNDSKSDYRIELGRRPIDNNSSENDNTQKTNYIYVTSSNEIESPNDHILFDKNQKMVYFRNVKTGKETAKPFATLSFIRNMGKIYEIYDLYKELYKDEENLEDLTNPSSQSSSSFR